MIGIFALILIAIVCRLSQEPSIEEINLEVKKEIHDPAKQEKAIEILADENKRETLKELALVA